MFDLRKTNRVKTFGNSMYPILHDGDVIYYEKVDFDSVKINHIVLVKLKTKYITHRIIYRTFDKLVVKGDNNLKAEVGITKEDYIGKVTFIKRGNKKLRPQDIYLIQSSMYLKEIQKVMKAFEKNNISYIFLKGLPLHLYYESTHPQRYYADCDILINPSDFSTVLHLMEKIGYSKIENYLIKQKGQRFYSEVSFLKIENGFPIIFDIHVEPVFIMVAQINTRNMFYPSHLLEQMSTTFLSNKRIIPVGKDRYPVLSSSELILYLCLHFFHHNFKDIFRLEFIDKIIRKEIQQNENVWKQLELLIIRYDVESFVYPVFLLARKYYNTPIPYRFLNTITPQNKIKHWITQYISIINVFNGETRIQAGVSRFILLLLLSSEPFYKKVIHLFHPQVIKLALWVMLRRLARLIYKLVFGIRKVFNK